VTDKARPARHGVVERRQGPAAAAAAGRRALPGREEGRSSSAYRALEAADVSGQHPAIHRATDRPTAVITATSERTRERERESKAIITAANYIHSVAETTPSAHDTKSYSSVRSKPDKSQLNLPHGTELKSGKEKN